MLHYEMAGYHELYLYDITKTNIYPSEVIKLVAEGGFYIEERRTHFHIQARIRTQDHQNGK